MKRSDAVLIVDDVATAQGLGTVREGMRRMSRVVGLTRPVRLSR